MMEVMRGKRGLVMGVANDHSIAWGVAETLAKAGAELAFTYQSANIAKRLRPLAQGIGSNLLFECDVEQPEMLENVFTQLQQRWGGLDFVVHAIGFSDKAELKGRYCDNTTRENFSRTMLISAYSFTETCQHARKLMNKGGSILTFTYGASMHVVPNYNVMGIAKAALEAMVRYIAADLGSKNIRVNAISAGPIRTLAGSGIGSARAIFSYQRRTAPLKRSVTIEEVGQSALYLLSDMSAAVTGEIHYVDSGYNIMSMPGLEELQAAEEV